MAVRITERDTGFKDFMRSLNSIDGYKITAGVHEEEGSQIHGPSNLPISNISVIHEFGAPQASIPARPHIRAAFDKNQKVYERQIIRRSEALLRRRADPQKDYEVIGELMRSDIEAAMRAGIAGENGKVATLIDTGEYLDNIKGKAKRK